jgi:hypothetical protein
MDKVITECASPLTCETCLIRLRKLQFKIVKALEEKRFNKAKALQYLLDNSIAQKCLEFQTTKKPV